MAVIVLNGDVLAMLATLPDDHFDCIVTSPPYWGLRDYGVEGQLGLEPTIGEHLDAMVRVFRELRRVLKPSGTCWVNYGDCYATTPAGLKADSAGRIKSGSDDRTFTQKPFSTIQGVLKTKDLCMVPNRLAIALQEDGWLVRSEIIWAKPNPMPESVTDRPAGAHEKIFLLTKAPRYDYDAEAVRQKCTDNTHSRGTKLSPPNESKPHGRKGWTSSIEKKAQKQRGHQRPHAGFNGRWDQMSKQEQQANGRALRNYEPAPVEVWMIATKPFSGAHFATFPPELVERCIKAGCPEGGNVLDPFGGAGTTGLMADVMGRDCTLIELNPEYVEIIHERLERKGKYKKVPAISELTKTPMEEYLAEVAQ